MAQSFPRVTISPDLCHFVGLHGGASVIRGLPGVGIVFNHLEFHIFAVKAKFLHILFDFKKKAMQIFIKGEINFEMYHV